MGTRSYGISNPKFWPAIVLLVVAYAAFLVIMLLRADPDEWQILVVPTLPLLPLAYILHRCSLSWIRIKDEEVEIVPSWFRRKFWGEQSKNARFDSGSELLFCQRFACGAFDGYFILLRSRSGTDLTMWSTVNHSTGAGRRWWSRIAQEISDTCHLNTRLIEQTVSSQGTQEADWPTGSGKKLWRLRALILPALAPWLGIGARVLTADSLKLVGTGVLLWIGCAGLMLHWIQSRRGTLRWQDLSTGMLVFTLQFATFYTLTVLVTGAVLHR